jgi:DNA-binding SARP family transcriptional activator
MFELHALGDPSVLQPDRSPLDALTRQPKRFALLIYLACGPGRLSSRDDLLATFWPESDESNSRNCLRQSLHVLRGLLGDDALLGHGNQDVGVNRARVLVDVVAFRRALASGAPAAALELYAGDFLRGFHARDLPAFESWVEDRRHEFRSAAIGAAKQLAYTSEGRDDLDGALHWWRRASELEPFDEPVVRRIAALLACAGQRAEAIQVLDVFAERLGNELEVEPAQETRVLREAVKRGRGPAALPDGFGDRRTGRASHLTHWRRASDHLSLGDALAWGSAAGAR